ncbi:MAG: glutamyl-tRNA reductase [Bacillota bacterium]|nr:glutamyl-tRNA reductase [Bacillota bacterium]
MFVVAVGMNHRTAPVEVREKFAFGKTGLISVLREVKELPPVQGCVVLSTCNRTEIYAAVTQVQEGQKILEDYLQSKAQLPEQDGAKYFQNWTCYEAISHLFRVAAGLDSMILGETEILGQVRGAYELACRLKVGNNVINTLFQEAIKIGKRVRTVTGIDQHPASVSYAAVELVKQTFGNLGGCTVLIIGAGEMGELTLKHLVAQGVSTILVSNRSYDRAEALARLYGGEAIRYDLLFSQLERTDIVISCTAAPHFVISGAQVHQAVAAKKGRPLFLLDIAVPRDIEPTAGQIPGVILYDIDDLEHVVLEYMEERKKAAVVAEKMISEAVTEFLKWLSTLSVVPTIRVLQEKGEEIKEAELRRYLRRLGKLDPRSEKIIRGLANSIINKLLHTPIIRLKEYACKHEGHLYSQILENLFDLKVQSGDSEVFPSEVRSCEGSR